MKLLYTHYIQIIFKFQKMNGPSSNCLFAYNAVLYYSMQSLHKYYTRKIFMFIS